MMPIIDCSKAENYLKERGRMTNNCTISCYDCDIGITNNGLNIICSRLEEKYPQVAIRKVQKWSDEHQIKTLLDAFNERFPKANLDDDGFPYVCPSEVGLTDGTKELCFHECDRCWNRLLEEVK